MTEAQPSNKTFLTVEISPVKQGIAALALSIIAMLIGFAIHDKSVSNSAMLIWKLGVAVLLFFVILNSILSYPSSRTSYYWTRSIAVYVVLVLITGLVATWLSGISIEEAGSLKWIITVFSLCYLIFLAMIGAMKNIIEIAQRQDKRFRNEE